MSVDLTYVDAALERIGRSPDAVIPILQALQDHYGYLPEDALRRVCAETQITPAAISGVSTFYDMFRHEPSGKHIVQVCHGTACHVGGAERVEDALRHHLHIPEGADTDAKRQFTIERVACLGCCTLAPVVRIEEQTFGYATAEKVPGTIHEFLASKQSPVAAKPAASLPARGNGGAEVKVCLDSCCLAKGTDRVFHALQESLAQNGVNATVKRVGCVGACYRTPMVEVAVPGKPSVTYAGLTLSQTGELVQRHFRPRGLARRMSGFWAQVLDGLLVEDGPATPEVGPLAVGQNDADKRAFFDRQVHIATEYYGRLDPLDLDECLAHDGFAALARCLGVPNPKCVAQVSKPADARPSFPQPADSEFGDATGRKTCVALAPEAIISTIERSGLRGRGGAGFPTGQKWRMVNKQPGETKYVICNGDEGDPGAFMDRMILESFPYRVIEGLAIAAVAVGAHEAVFYIRHEYPQALRRVRAALAECERRGWLGARLLGSDYPLRISIKEGAGAFVCGEETALIASVEGRRGMPRLRPPFPAQSGLWGKPTLINNVETLAMVPWIIRHGAEKFAAIGTATSKGTKVFSLAGKIRRAGLIEIPMGTTLRQIVEGIGGGVAAGRAFKAVQMGGPSGGCVPARLADTPVDYESLREIGAIMGSGGMVVLDDTACMVDIARYFLQFTQNQSCGKCTFCRIGTKRMLELLELLCAGTATRNHLQELEQLAPQVSQGSLCGLGKTAPNPVLTTLRYFREEYEAHLQGRCPAGKCKALIKYSVRENCTGCTLCAQHCPADAIPMTPYVRHVIDLEKCTRCDSCRQVCPCDAIEVV
jgi:NADH:ubiquinone oxidoreductase subunit F (NADH-binding)/NADH:ubiquinone oxidoreductase subunit E/Pyruvate/2-oxoacid:ferredoxin oxidoreductase delta subunit